MTAPSTQERARRAQRRPTVDLLVALLALLAQVALPHLHAAQTAAHLVRTQRAADAVRQLAIERVAGPDEGHAESRCPVCQALAHAHDFLPTAAGQRTLHDESSAASASSGIDHARERIATHAPRSPPLAI